MRMVLLAVTVNVLACTGDSGTSGTGDVIDTVEFPFDKDLGTPRATAWTSTEIAYLFNLNCFGVVPGDRLAALSLDSRSIDLYEHTSATPLRSVDLGLADGHTLECTEILGTDDGKLFTFALERGPTPNAIGHPVMVAIDASGQVSHVTPLTDGTTVTSLGRATILTSGSLAVVMETAPASGSLDTAAHVVALFAVDGTPGTRTKIPDVHLPDQDRPGEGATPEQTPGTGRASMKVLAPTPDGGFVAAGAYGFYRNIECGTQNDPQDPVVSACGNGTVNGLVARFDATGQLVWTSRIGNGYKTEPLNYSAVTVLSDGAILATGTMQNAVGVVTNPPMLALATRHDASGRHQWTQGFAWGRLPGAAFFDGGSQMDSVSPAAAGAADVILHPPKGADCRLVRLEANGSVSAVQRLSTIADGCASRSLGDQIVISTRTAPGASTQIATAFLP